MLFARRLLTRRIRLGTDRSDKVLFPLLSRTVLLGIGATAVHDVLGGGYDYRATVSVWFRGVLTLTACLLLAAWPFTRLIHVGSAPVGVCRGRATTVSPAGADRPMRSAHSWRNLNTGAVSEHRRPTCPAPRTPSVT